MTDQGKWRPRLKRLITLLARVDASVTNQTDPGTGEGITKTDQGKWPPMPKRLITLLSVTIVAGLVACGSEESLTELPIGGGATQALATTYAAVDLGPAAALRSWP
jgi:hypothetical protein